jgi:hypothetical protein
MNRLGRQQTSYGSVIKAMRRGQKLIGADDGARALFAHAIADFPDGGPWVCVGVHNLPARSHIGLSDSLCARDDSQPDCCEKPSFGFQSPATRFVHDHAFSETLRA